LVLPRAGRRARRDQVAAGLARVARLAERLAWAGVWTDSGRCFPREDGTPLRPSWVSQRFDTLTARAELPPITLHGLRHGSATMALAAGVPIKAISEMLGHSTSAFTADVATEVAEDWPTLRPRPSLLTCPGAARSFLCHFLCHPEP
jgi:integrase